MSTFAWIDNSSEDRRRVLDAIEKLKETESRDELGLATIRDGFANALFPGTGTLQTRAGYFLFVPWAYRQLHRRKVNHDQVETAGRKEEIRLINALLESDDTDGVIGKVSRDKLKRLPSSVYWNGLRTWRIFEQNLTLDEYHRQFEYFREAADGARDDDRQLLDGSTRRDWHPALPVPPDDFPKVTFKLRAIDRAFLTERITLSVGSSLLAWLLRHAQTLEGDAPWEHPQVRQFPDGIQKLLVHAQCFSDAMHGAPLLYNLMLAERAGEQKGHLVDKYRQQLRDWSARLKSRRTELSAWSLSAFWQFTQPLMRVTRGTTLFVQDWVSLHSWGSDDGMADNAAARDLIHKRERQLKGPRARLDNQRALELWGQDSGTGRLVYRWFSAIRILRDLRPELTDHVEP